MARTKSVACAALSAAVLLLPLASHAGTFTTLYNFTGGADGALPFPVSYHDGGLYGVTQRGGNPACPQVYSFGGCGTVFKVDATTGAFTLVYSFTGGADGATPSSDLIFNGGAVYGTATQRGGTSCTQPFATGCGVVYRVDLATGAQTVTYRFTGGTDGNSPTGPLAFANGILYGATASGGGSGCGGNGCGTVFAVDLATGAETVLHRFTGGADGANPVPGVTYACGILYGAAASGGAAGAGTVFRIDPATGRFTLLHGLGGAAEGAYPNEVIYHRGHLYAATQQGGGSGVGVVFDINLRTRAETVLLDFPGGAGGGLPLRSPIFAHGMLYGTTGFGGAHGVGVLYKLNPATGVETVLHTFDGADGSWIVGPTYQAGTFYGPTAQGGSFGYGTVYKFAP